MMFLNIITFIFFCFLNQYILSAEINKIDNTTELGGICERYFQFGHRFEVPPTGFELTQEQIEDAILSTIKRYLDNGYKLDYSMLSWAITLHRIRLVKFILLNIENYETDIDTFCLACKKLFPEAVELLLKHDKNNKIFKCLDVNTLIEEIESDVKKKVEDYKAFGIPCLEVIRLHAIKKIIFAYKTGIRSKL